MRAIRPPLRLRPRRSPRESEFNLVLMTESVDAMKAAVEACAFKKPLLYAATAANAEEMGEPGKRKGTPPGRQGGQHG